MDTVYLRLFTRDNENTQTHTHTHTKQMHHPLASGSALIDSDLHVIVWVQRTKTFMESWGDFLRLPHKRLILASLI